MPRTTARALRSAPFGSVLTGRGVPASRHYVILPGTVLAVALPWLWMFDDYTQAALVVAQLLLCSCGIVSSYVTGLRPMRLVFFVFTMSWLGVGPLYQISHRRLAWSDSGLLNDTNGVTAALALTLLATATTAVAMWRAGTRHAPLPTAEAARPTATRPVRARSWAPWGYLGLLTVLTPYAVATNGGIGAFFSSRADRIEDLTAAGVTVADSGGLQVALASILPAALAVVAAHLFVLRIRVARAEGGWMHASLSDAAGLVYALGAVVLYANPISNTRFLSLAAFGSIALAMVRPRSRTAGRGMAFLLLVATLGVYPLSNAFASDTGATAGESPLAVFGGKDFDGFQQIINTFIYVDDHGYTLGKYISSALFFVVPRSLWPDKATPAAIDVAANRDYWFTNLSLPVHAEVYLEFGLVGMLLFAYAMGHVWARVDHSWLHRPGGMGAWLAPFLALAQLGLIRGPLGSLSPIWLTVTILLALGVTRLRPAGPAPEPLSPDGGAADARPAAALVPARG